MMNPLNPFQSSVAHHSENSPMIYAANQMTGFYIKCNTILKWVKVNHEKNRSY